MLESIHTPKDIKGLSIHGLNALAEEIRQVLISVVSENGGHLASNLGVVELTLALHKCFDSPRDQFVWDVGHQCYTHKILTGRKGEIVTLRQKDGISGFPKPYESIHDIFVAGHSSTSISAALGLAQAKRIKNEDGYVIAVIGDGAFTGGMVYEALNNAGKSNTRLIVVLNDNEMSISKNVGSVAKYLSDIRSRKGYYRVKDAVARFLRKIPVVGKSVYNFFSKSKDYFKSLIYRNTFFEDLGFQYLGPIDGHDIEKLIDGLERAKGYDKPVLLHINTQKGKGYQKAEENPGHYHGVPKFDVDKGNPDISGENSFSTAFGRYLVKKGLQDNKICAITAAMKYGTGLQFFYHNFPNRFFDVGIAEEHAVTFAAGLATNGLKPVFAVYSSFSQRCVDQLIHDVAIQRAGVVLAIDRAGIVGQDGETHQGIFDVSLLSGVPNVEIYSPSNYYELNSTMDHVFDTRLDHLAVIRYPRGSEDERLQFLNGRDLHGFDLFENGGDKVVVTYGRIFADVYFAAQQAGCDVLKLNRIFPISSEIAAVLSKYKKVIFVEEGIYEGGISQQIASVLAEQGYAGKVAIRAIKQKIVPQAKVDEAYKSLLLDYDSILNLLSEE